MSKERALEKAVDICKHKILLELESEINKVSFETLPVGRPYLHVASLLAEIELPRRLCSIWSIIAESFAGMIFTSRFPLANLAMIYTDQTLSVGR